MDNYKFLLTDKQSVFLLCCKIDKRKNTSYLSNNCKYDVFYNYVKILNLMTLPSGAISDSFLLQYGKKKEAI